MIDTECEIKRKRGSNSVILISLYPNRIKSLPLQEQIVFFLHPLNPFWKSYVVQASKQELTEAASFLITHCKHFLSISETLPKVLRYTLQR